MIVLLSEHFTPFDKGKHVDRTTESTAQGIDECLWIESLAPA